MAKQRGKYAGHRKLQVYLDPETHAKLRVWCEEQDTSVQRGVARLIRGTVAGVDPAKIKALAPAKANGFAPGWDDEPEEPKKPFDPWEMYMDRLYAGDWIPDALAQVDAECRRHKYVAGYISAKLNESFVEEYRKTALAAGRDPEADLQVHEKARGLI